ncbi:hypothetical protein OIU84_017066 [Salix udensis]|uniref:Uncharacterized protein n=1 Tax=Salix udensis TaxID=889485 RepID=A0AAD6L3A1_9ROSI|nr:hypothetical protein OIU84_017066 [Salix udensis]
MKKFLASDDAVSDFFRMLSDLIKKFMASDAVSDFIRMLSDLIKKLMASDVVVYVVKWFNKQNVTALVAVAVIGLLMICCCCKCLRKKKRFGGKTMKAPGQDFRILRDDFEANPSGYFRNKRSMEKTSSVPASLRQWQQTDPFFFSSSSTLL